MKRLYLLPIPLLAAPAAWLACNAIAGIEEPTVAQSDCEHTAPPSPPKMQDNGSLDLVFALRNVQFGKREGSSVVPSAPGYDLDGVCTCPGEPSCKPVFPSDKHCDLSGGRDNGFVDLYAEFSVLLGMDGINEEMNEGGFGFLILVSGYNGTDNDPVVRLSFHSSAGLANGLGDAGVPGWAGTDIWNIDSASFADAGSPKFMDTSAYVSGGVLVSRLPSAELYFPMFGAPLRFDIFDAMVTARISKGDSGPYHLSEGQVSGRMPVDSMLRTIAPMPYSDAGMLCLSDGSYPFVRAEACRMADILYKSGSPAAKCDAMSFVLGFEGVQAVSGGSVTVPHQEAGTCPAQTQYGCEGVAGW